MTRVKANLDLREQAKNAGVYLWQIAAAIGVSEPTFNRCMWVEMPENEKEQRKRCLLRTLESKQQTAHYTGELLHPLRL